MCADRRSKAALLEADVPKLEKLVRKGKNVTKIMIEDRMAKVCILNAGHDTMFGLPNNEQCLNCRSNKFGMPLQTFQMACMDPASQLGYAAETLPIALPARTFQREVSCFAMQLGTGKVPIGGSATVELSGPDARAMNNPAYYQHSEESKRLADVSCCLGMACVCVCIRNNLIFGCILHVQHNKI